MKFWCKTCKKIVDVLSSEDYKEESEHKLDSVAKHTHCNECQSVLSVEDIRDEEYIKTAINKCNTIIKNGAQPAGSNQPASRQDNLDFLDAYRERNQLVYAWDKITEARLVENKTT